MLIQEVGRYCTLMLFGVMSNMRRNLDHAADRLNLARLLARFMYGSAGMKKHHSDRGPLPSRRAYVSLHQHVDCM